MRRHAIAVLLSLLTLTTLPTHADQLHIAWWNVENLFDTVDDPRVQGDEEFTPSGPKKWDEQRLNRKLANLAGVIKKMNGGKDPDVFGLCEVENKTVVELLVTQLGDLGRTYHVIHKDSPSERGIDVAIVYDAAKLDLKDSKFHAVTGLNTRDIAEGEFQVAGQKLWVFANHWPSQTHPEDDRNKAADVLRQRVDAILAADQKADMIILGDLNDHPGDPAVTEHLRTTDDPAKAINGALYDTMWPIQNAERGTYVFKNKWEIIDHVIVSPGLLEAGGLRWKRGSTSEVKFKELIFDPKGDKQIPRPNRTFTGNSHHATGISDHLPVECVLEY